MKSIGSIVREALSIVLLVASSLLAAEPRNEIQFPDVSGYQTLKCDFHLHTVFSDGYVWPTIRVEEAWREGLDAIALTDHIEYQPHRKDLPTNHNRPYALAAEVARERNILLIRGGEITRDTPPGHFNAIFLSDIDPLNVKEFYPAFEQAHQQGAFVFWNHPGWKGPELGRWGEEQTNLLAKGQLQGIEICNGETHYEDAHRWSLEKHLTLLGNSDMHEPSPFQARSPTNHRTATLVLAKDRTLGGLKDALLAGRTMVWYGNQLIGREEFLSAMFAACVHIAPPHLHSRDALWVNVANSCELDIELKATGPAKPAKLTLPARSTTLVKFDLKASDASIGLAYKATNLLVGLKQPLAVRLVIPPAPASRPEDGSR